MGVASFEVAGTALTISAAADARTPARRIRPGAAHLDPLEGAT